MFSKLIVCVVMLAALAIPAGAADILWSNPTGTDWLTTTNWTGSVVPTSADNAQIGVNPTAATGVGINFSTTTNDGVQANGSRIEDVGAIELTSARAANFIVGNNSTVAGSGGTLKIFGTTVNSVPNTILRNASASNLTLTNIQGSGTQTMTVALTNTTDNIVFLDGAGNITISTGLTGSSTRLTVNGTGAGDLILSGTNTYDGGTFINGAKLRTGVPAAIPGTGAITVSGAGRLRFSAAGTYGTAGQNLIFNPNQIASASIDLQTSNIAVTWQGNVAINADSRIESNGATGALTFSGAVSGSGLISKQAAGNLTFAGTNSLTGGTLIGNGTVTVNSGSSMGTGPVQLFQGSGNNTAIALKNAAQTIGSLSSQFTNITGTQSQTIALTGTALTVIQTTDATFGPGAVATLTSVISGTGSLIKSGGAALTLAGTQTYTGGTQVTAGALVVNGSIAASSGVAVSGGARLRGTGAVSAISGGGLVYPGTSTHATLPLNADETLTGTTLDLSSGGTLGVQVSTSGTGGVHKQMLTLSGAAVLGGTSTLSVGSEAGSYGAIDIVILQTAAGGILNPFGSVSVPAGLQVVYTKAGADITPDGTAGNAADKVVLRPTGAVSPVTVDAFSARAQGAGVIIEWTAVSEFQNAGFNVLRREVGSSDWERVNPALILGRITNPDAKKYALLDWAWPGIYDYKLESVGLAGTRESDSKFSASVMVEWNAPTTLDALNASADVLTSALDNLALSRSAQRTLEVSREAKARGTVTALAASKCDTAAQPLASVRSAHAAWAASPRWFAGSVAATSNFSAARVRYTLPGILRIPQADLPAGFDVRHLAIQREGRGVTALAVTPDALLVYGPGYLDSYTNKDAFFLRNQATATAAGNVVQATGLFASPLPVDVTSPATASVQYHDVYFDYNYRPYAFEPWFSSKYLAGGTTQSFDLATPDAAAGPATLTVTLWSLTQSDAGAIDHQLDIVINSNRYHGHADWSGGGRMMQLTFDLPSNVLVDGVNQIELATPSIVGVDNQMAFLHSLSVSYTRALNGSTAMDVFNSDLQPKLFELNNVPAAGAWVVDARFPERAALVPTETQAQIDGTLRLRFVAGFGGLGKFVVVPIGQENAADSIERRTVKPAKINGNYLAAGPAQFASGVAPLLSARRKEGVRGAFIDQEQLFDTYNYGRYGPDAIRNAVRALRPQYLLLVGRTTYDYLNYSGANIDPLCPSFLVSTSFWSQTTSDSAFGDLGRGFPEVAVGRLPVTSAAELAGAVQHIVSYKGMPASGIRLHAVADKPDLNVANFGAQLDTLLKAGHPDMTWQENYLQRTYATSAEVNAAMTAAVNGGADLVLYSGHGNTSRLGESAPRILFADDVQAWTGRTVFLQATCAAHWMAADQTGFKSIAIQALTQPQGGIAAGVGTSTYMNPDAATAFMNQLLTNADKTGTRWGTALLKTQQWAGAQAGAGFYRDLMKSEQLFGDPAMPVFNVIPAVGEANGSVVKMTAEGF